MARAPALSPTKVGTLLTCPKQYAFSYEEKGSKKDEAADFFYRNVGTLCHLAFARAATERIRGTIARSVPCLGKELSAYLNGDHGAAEANDAAALGDAKALLEARRILADASPTRLDDVQLVEQWWEEDIGGVLCRGRIDRVDVSKDQKTVRIVDYKSGYPKPRAELEVEAQTVMYLVAAVAMYPFAEKIVVTYDFFAAGARIDIPATPHLLDYAADMAKAAQGTIERCRAKKEWPAEVGSNCGHCDYRSRCPDYQIAVRAEVPTVLSDLQKRSDTELLDERQRCHAMAALAENRKKEYDIELKRRLGPTAGDLVGSSGWRARIISRELRDFPDAGAVVKTLAAVTGKPLSEVAKGVLQVSTTAVDKFVAALPKDVQALLEEALEGHVARNSTPYIDVRKIKGGF